MKTQILKELGLCWNIFFSK